MTTSHRTAMLSLVSMIALAPGHSSGAAEWRPEKPIEIVSGVAAGGALDITARVIQKILQDKRKIGQPVTVVNRPGSGSAVAWAYLNTHPGDGHYLSVTSNTLLTNAITGANPLTYTDVTPICQLLREYIVFVVRADSPLKSGGELVERLKKDATSVSFGIATSLGNSNHIAIAQVARTVGINVRTLRVAVFNASPQAMAGVLGGHLDVMVSSASTPLPQIQSGQLRAIAVAAPHRLGVNYANVPVWKEMGINVVASFWRGVIGPKGMTPAQIAYWETELARVVQTEEWKKYEVDELLESDYRNSVESKKFLQSEYADHKAILTELGLAK